MMRLLSILIVLACVAPVQSKDGKIEDLTVLLRSVQERTKMPAMGVAVVRSSGLVGIGAAGVRASGDKTPVTKDDRWHLGSCTKAMTATLVARLVEQGKLEFDDKLAARLKPLAPKMHEAFRDVTLALLLQNRGGAPASLDARGLWGRLWKRDKNPRAKRTELLQDVLAHAPANTPGTEYLYSNAGFAIAGAVAEHVMDASWEDLMRKHVFDPLGMKSAGFGAPGSADKVTQPRGHRNVGGDWVPIDPGPHGDNPPAIGPAGTVHATLEDWGRFVSLHLRGARGQEKKFLKPKTFGTLHAPPQGQQYAMGWLVTARGWADGKVLNHAGSNTMWFCVTWVAPEVDFAVLVTCNAAGERAASACDDVAGAMIRRFLKQRDR